MIKPDDTQTTAPAPGETLNAAGMATQAGVAEGTIRNYLREFNLPSWKETSGERRMPASLLPIIRQIAALKKRGLSQEEILANIEAPDPDGRNVLLEERARLAQLPTALGGDLTSVIDAVVQRLAPQLEQRQEQLKTELVKALVADVGGLREEIGALRAEGRAALQRAELAERQVLQLPQEAASLQEAASAKITAAETARARAEALHQVAEQSRAQLAEQLADARTELQQATRRAQDAEMALQQSRHRAEGLEARSSAQAAQIDELRLALQQLQTELETEKKRGLKGLFSSKK